MSVEIITKQDLEIMNYIRHLNAVMIRFTEDDRLRPSHISLYLALFQLWNANRFRNPISISRTEVMRISKIGSMVTYHKCLKHLHEYEYLEYLPSFNPLVGSQVNLYTFETGTVQVVEQEPTKSETGTVQVVKPYINSINKEKQSKGEKGSQAPFTPPGLGEIISFFKKRTADSASNSGHEMNNETEARRFYSHYQANGWRVGSNPMQDWQAAAENWLLKIPQFNSHQKPRNGHSLSTDQHKNYDEPL